MRDLEDLAAYIAADSEQTAENVESRIRVEAELLARFPLSGRMGRVSESRERIIRRTPYILVYRVALARVLILRVYHGARRWPSRFD